jgi:hypothetical protein
VPWCRETRYLYFFNNAVLNLAGGRKKDPTDLTTLLLSSLVTTEHQNSVSAAKMKMSGYRRLYPSNISEAINPSNPAISCDFDNI